jgi:hypothetical protein
MSSAASSKSSSQSENLYHAFLRRDSLRFSLYSNTPSGVAPAGLARDFQPQNQQVFFDEATRKILICQNGQLWSPAPMPPLPQASSQQQQPQSSNAISSPPSSPSPVHHAAAATSTTSSSTATPSSVVAVPRLM